jgi:hypothetical protein
MKKKIGLGILTFLPLFAATVESRACIGHFLEDEWPPREMFHLLMGLSGLLATYMLILILVWIPLRHGERWAWYAIAAAALSVVGLVLTWSSTGRAGHPSWPGSTGFGTAPRSRSPISPGRCGTEDELPARSI